MRGERTLDVNGNKAVVFGGTSGIGLAAARQLTEGPIRVGSRFLLKQPLQRPTIWEVTACKPGESFTWETREVRREMRATHRVEARGGGTRNTLILEAPGVPAILRPLLRPVFAQALAKENAGLREFCEGTARRA